MNSKSFTAVLVSMVVSFVLLKLADARDQQHCSTLYLLNVQPYPDESEFSGFDGGLSLIPAAHLAAEEINNRLDILTGLELRVIDIDAEACGRATITKGLVNLLRELFNRDCIVGIIGSPCSSSTNILAPVTGHQGIGYITLANSVSPEHRDKTNFPNLFHTISSSSVHNKVLVSLMQIFNWRRIGLVYESLALFFRSTAKDFIQRVHDLPEAELTTDVPIISTLQSIKSAFNIIDNEEARISYWLGTDGQNALFVCEAYKRRFLWPGYVYILRYNPDIVYNLLIANTSCSKTEMLTAMEGIFMLDYRLFVDEDTALFSGWTYREFRQRYAGKLNAFASQLGMKLTESIYANSFYDQVWTFALAINNSLSSIYSENLSFSDYEFNSETLSNIVKHQLLNLSFQGASGWIQFNDNHEISSFVDIFQIQKGIVQHIAVYNPFSLNITPTEKFPDSIPPDTFDTFTFLLPYWLGVCILVAQGALFVLITTNLILMLKWRRKKEIKATSPLLSILMMIGCYAVCMTPVLMLVYRMFAVENENLISVLCHLKTWLSAGLELILATLFWKMLRIHHIFHTKQMTYNMSEYLKDKYLFIYAILLCLGKIVVLIVYSGVSPTLAEVSREYVHGPHEVPHYMATARCIVSPIWSSIYVLYFGVLLFMLVVLAIETRHIRNEAYKDTKKVNIFIFLVTAVLANTITLLFVFSHVGIENGANVAEWLTFFSVPLLCQVCLFVPKTLPLCVKPMLRRYSLY